MNNVLETADRDTIGPRFLFANIQHKGSQLMLGLIIWIAICGSAHEIQTDTYLVNGERP